MKEKRKVDYLKEEEQARKNLPTFFLVYNIMVLSLLIATFLVLLLVVILPESGNGNVMLTAVLTIQLIGLFYFIPCYLFPEVYFLMRYPRFRKANISLLCVSTLFYTCFYPLFQLFLVFLG